jgi:hypothetical protein
MCLADGHLVFALTLGLLALAAAVAYPLVWFVLLYRANRRGSLQHGCRFWVNYAQLWEEYRCRTYWWGSMREGRKLVLVAVGVGLRMSSDAMQALGAWSVVLAMLASHLAVTPFHNRHLNILQLIMLVAVLLTVYLNSFTSIGDISQGAQTALQVLVLLIDVGVLVILVVMLLMAAWGPVRAWLDYDGDGVITRADLANRLRHVQSVSSNVSRHLTRSVARGLSIKRASYTSSMPSLASLPPSNEAPHLTSSSS